MRKSYFNYKIANALVSGFPVAVDAVREFVSQSADNYEELGRVSSENNDLNRLLQNREGEIAILKEKLLEKEEKNGVD